MRVRLRRARSRLSQRYRLRPPLHLPPSSPFDHFNFPSGERPSSHISQPTSTERIAHIGRLVKQQTHRNSLQSPLLEKEKNHIWSLWCMQSIPEFVPLAVSCLKLFLSNSGWSIASKLCANIAHCTTMCCSQRSLSEVQNCIRKMWEYFFNLFNLSQERYVTFFTCSNKSIIKVKKVAYLSCDKLKKLKKYSHIFLMCYPQSLTDFCTY